MRRTGKNLKLVYLLAVAMSLSVSAVSAEESYAMRPDVELGMNCLFDETLSEPLLIFILSSVDGMDPIFAIPLALTSAWRLGGFATIDFNPRMTLYLTERGGSAGSLAPLLGMSLWPLGAMKSGPVLSLNGEVIVDSDFSRLGLRSFRLNAEAGLRLIFNSKLSLRAGLIGRCVLNGAGTGGGMDLDLGLGFLF